MQENETKVNPSRWKPGQSGNPKGSPKRDESLTGLMREFLRGIDEKTGKERRQMFIEKAFKKAEEEGDNVTMKLIWNYLDGLPQGHLDLTSKGDTINQSLKVEFVNGKRPDTSEV